LLVYKGAYKRIFFVILFRKGPKFLLPLYIHSCSNDKNLNLSDKAEAKINSLIHGQSIMPGILAPVFKKPVQMVSRFGPDLVQILRSRPSGPILVTTQCQCNWIKKESSSKKTTFSTNKFNWYKYKICTHVYRTKSCCKIKFGCLMTKYPWMKNLNTFCYLTKRKKSDVQEFIVHGNQYIVKKRE
jgi:hypothetical protein